MTFGKGVEAGFSPLPPGEGGVRGGPFPPPSPSQGEGGTQGWSAGQVALLL